MTKKSHGLLSKDKKTRSFFVVVVLFLRKLVTGKIQYCNHEESELVQVPQHFKQDHFQ